ncbi:MAG TPA: hypothetical protein VGD94_18915, partial [Vicinamibacterales bacterium]
MQNVKLLERLIGQGFIEGATPEAIVAYLEGLTDDDGNPAPIADAQTRVDIVGAKKRIPELGAAELRSMGGRNVVRAAFGLPAIQPTEP